MPSIKHKTPRHPDYPVFVDVCTSVQYHAALTKWRGSMHHKDQRAFLFRRLVDPKQLEGFEAQGVRPFVVALDGSLAPVMQQAVKDTHAMVWTGEDFGKVCPLFTGAVSRWEEIYGAKSKRVGVY